MNLVSEVLLTEENVKYFCDKIYMEPDKNMQNARDTIKVFIEQQEQGNIYMEKSFILSIDDCVREYGNRWWTFPSLDALIAYEKTEEFSEEYLRSGVGKFIFALSSGCYILCTDFMNDEYVYSSMSELDVQIEEYLGIEKLYKTNFPHEYKMVMNEARIIQKAYDKELESDKFGYAFHSDIIRFIDRKTETYKVVTRLTHLTVFRIVNK